MTILKDVVSYLPAATDDVLNDPYYKTNLIMQIDYALSVLKQNGIGVETYLTADQDLDWDDFFGNTVTENGKMASKQYVFTQVVLTFDSPPSNVVSILEKSLDQSLWRARLESLTDVQEEG